MKRNAFLILVMLLSSLTCDDMVGDIKGVKDKNNLIILSRLISEAGIDGIVYPSGVYSHWKLDKESGNAVDSKDNNDLEQFGSITTIAGKLDSARGNFTSSIYLKYDCGGSSVPLQEYVFLVEGWFKIAITANMHMIGRTNDSITVGYYLGCRSGNLIFDAVGGGNINTSFAPYTDNKWHYVVAGNLATTGTNMKRIYVDGNLAVQGDGSSFTKTSIEDFGLGCYFTGAGQAPRDPFQGYLDDWAYWNLPPSTWAEVEEIISKRWNNGAGRRYISAP